MNELYELLYVNLDGLTTGNSRVEVSKVLDRDGAEHIAVAKVNATSGDVEAGWRFVPKPI